MSKRHKIILFTSIAVVCVGVTLLFAFKKVDQKKQDEETSGIVFPIKYGDRGEHVRKLQQAANIYMRRYPSAFSNFEALEEDGIWGDKTADVLYYAFSVNNDSISEEKYKAIISLIE
jgi:hypothetical protein